MNQIKMSSSRLLISMQMHHSTTIRHYIKFFDTKFLFFLSFSQIESECLLKKVCKIIGFAPSLLQIVVQNDIPEPVRQATAIQLKNFITRNWLEKDVDGNVGQMEFSIHEQDRTVVRNNIVESITQPEMLSNQKINVHLATCIYHIIKCDFPGRWPQIVEKIGVFLRNGDYNSWSGAILCLYQLVKNYEYKKADERGPLDEAMNILLPMIFDLIWNLMRSPEQTEECVLLQKNILKIYYTLIQVSFEKRLNMEQQC